MISTATNSVVATVPVGDFPASVAVTPDGTAAYVTCSADGEVTVIDTATHTVTGTIVVGGVNLAGIVFSPDGTLAYVAGNSAVFVIDTALQAVSATIPVPGDLSPIAITPDGAFLYTASFIGGTVYAIDTATQSVVASIPAGFLIQLLAVTPDGASVYVTRVFPGDVAVIDTATNTIAATVVTPSFASGIAFTADAATAYVALPQSSAVGVIDVATNTLTSLIPAGVEPQAIVLVTPQPPTPEDQVEALIAAIEALIAGGDLAQNTAAPLISKLEQVLAKLDGGQTGAACNQLNAFTNQVNAYVANGSLTAADGQDLIDAVNAIRGDLGC